MHWLGGGVMTPEQTQSIDTINKVRTYFYANELDAGVFDLCVYRNEVMGVTFENFRRTYFVLCQDIEARRQLVDHISKVGQAWLTATHRLTCIEVE